MALTGVARWTVVEAASGAANTCRTEAERDQAIETLTGTGHIAIVYEYQDGEGYVEVDRVAASLED